MTVAAQTPPLAFNTIEEAIRAVRAGGMRLSTARRLVLEAFFAAEGPVSAVHLAQTLSIDESSVYRNLEVLERHGLIRHVHLGHGPGLYVLVGRHEVEYLYCEGCAKVTAVTPDQLDPIREQVKQQFGHEARFTHFAIVGLCEQCAAQPRRVQLQTARPRPVGQGRRH
jgi:Fur family transcriptional regulator, ferric uptake regulator